ncbi:MAG: extracellular solute-binding protein [Lachnospiraceae bacterium]|jgi:ABC-type glycerol-3-phosphate transport system substrate-binding protein|nr:extracellular solute-binding protein [Lachnospiraceae bacterium]
MRKQIKKMFALLLAGTLVLTSFTGCSKGVEKDKEMSAEVTETTENGAEETTQAETKEEASSLPETLDNPNITILWHTSEETYQTNKQNDPNAFDAVWSVLPEFEAKYGGKVEVKAVGWGEMKDTLINMVNAGEVCDLAQANDQNFPIYPVKKLIQPISGYIDANDDFWFDGITNAFTFGGESYAVGNDATPIVLYYNKSLFELMA